MERDHNYIYINKQTKEICNVPEENLSLFNQFGSGNYSENLGQNSLVNWRFCRVLDCENGLGWILINATEMARHLKY